MAYDSKEKTNAFFRKRYRKNKAIIHQYKLDKGCTDCGYNENQEALEFDHIKPHLRGTVASQMGKSMNVIMKEVDRCEVVCSNCHSIRTYNRRKETEKTKW